MKNNNISSIMKNKKKRIENFDQRRPTHFNLLLKTFKDALNNSTSQCHS